MSRWSRLVVGLGVLASVLGQRSQAAPGVQLAAHRGGALLWPENSLLAFNKAVELGADLIEFDVHLSRDGESVVIHDATLDRTTTGTGPVRMATLDALRALRLKDPSGMVTAQPVPTLDEVVSLAARARCRMLLEVKVDERRERYPGIEEKVLEVLDRHGMAASTVVMAFEHETWRRMRALRPALRTGALYSPTSLKTLHTTLAVELEGARRAGVAFLGLHQALVDAPTVTRVREAGLTLGVWTVNEADALRRFIDLGVEVLITDRPDLATRLLGR